MLWGSRKHDRVRWGSSTGRKGDRVRWGSRWQRWNLNGVSGHPRARRNDWVTGLAGVAAALGHVKEAWHYGHGVCKTSSAYSGTVLAGEHVLRVRRSTLQARLPRTLHRKDRGDSRCSLGTSRHRSSLSFLLVAGERGDYFTERAPLITDFAHVFAVLKK